MEVGSIGHQDGWSCARLVFQLQGIHVMNIVQGIQAVGVPAQQNFRHYGSPFFIVNVGCDALPFYLPIIRLGSTCRVRFTHQMQWARIILSAAIAMLWTNLWSLLVHEMHPTGLCA